MRNCTGRKRSTCSAQELFKEVVSVDQLLRLVPRGDAIRLRELDRFLHDKMDSRKYKEALDRLSFAAACEELDRGNLDQFRKLMKGTGEERRKAAAHMALDRAVQALKQCGEKARLHPPLPDHSNPALAKIMRDLNLEAPSFL
jgi:hypothetical protein